MASSKVLIVSLGGTITMTPSDAGGVVPTLTADDLVAAVPALPSVAEIETWSPSRTPSASLRLADLIGVFGTIEQRLRSDTAGAVIVQGTDTIEETAFLFDLLNATGRPVVVTGAMRGPQMPGADGPANLLDAVTVAADDTAAGLGAVAVLNGEVHAARYVRKLHTERPSAFGSPSLGPIGAVSEGGLRLLARPLGGHRIAFPADAKPAPVGLVAVGLDDDGALLEAASRLSYAGLVLEAAGAGHVSEWVAETVGRMAAALPVVLSTRVPGGRVFHATYGYPGSERDLIAKSLIPSGYLGAAKARILAALALGAGYDKDQLKDAFRDYD